MYILLPLILIFLFILLIFGSPKFSPIPYFPTNKKDLPMIIKAFGLKNNQIIFDLGAGDGRVIMAAAKTAWEKRLNTQFVAVEINPVLIIILHLRRFFHPNKKNIKIVWRDIFKINLKSQIENRKSTSLISNRSRKKNFKPITIYLYVSPWLINKIIEKCQMKIKNFSVISYMYPIKNKLPTKIFPGKNKIYFYNFR